jgi:Fic family protein
VEETSKQTIWIVKRIKELMQDYKNQIRAKHPKFYSQDLLNNLFRHPYTKIEYLQNDLGVSRITAMKYLNELSDSGLLQKNKIAKFNYYINQPLFDIFMNIPDESSL